MNHIQYKIFDPLDSQGSKVSIRISVLLFESFLTSVIFSIEALILKIKPVFSDKQENEQPDPWIVIAFSGNLEPSSFRCRDQKQRFFLKGFCTGVKYSSIPQG